jgi:hypothetical protein
VVNDSFRKHLEAKAIDHSKPPKPELAQHVHLTQKMYFLKRAVCTHRFVSVWRCVFVSLFFVPLPWPPPRPPPRISVHLREPNAACTEFS